MIRLGQLLKLAGVVESGGNVKSVLASGAVRVNGAVETRRGRQLHRGDVVDLSDHQAGTTTVGGETTDGTVGGLRVV